MKKVLWYLPVGFVFALGLGPAAFAQQRPCAAAVPCTKAPEIDSALVVSGLGLLAGAIAVVRASQRK
ncbi:MAG: hypothetical protein JOZ33_05410 [Acidobacteriaceae bacterium]|nr:hypothetical protein [Acidobacteriaceae bacterium]